MSIQKNGVIPKDKGKFRKLIRKQVVALLKNRTDAGPRVFANATTPQWDNELPAILVYPRSEPVSEYAQAPKELERDLTLEIEIYAEGPEIDEEGNPPTGKSLEDILDDMTVQVENALDFDDTLGGTCDESILTNTEFDFEGDGGQPLGSARLTFSVTYLTKSPRSVDKQGSLADFKSNKVDWNIGDDPKTREAKDTIDLPQT